MIIGEQVPRQRNKPQHFAGRLRFKDVGVLVKTSVSALRHIHKFRENKKIKMAHHKLHRNDSFEHDIWCAFQSYFLW